MILSGRNIAKVKFTFVFYSSNLVLSVFCFSFISMTIAKARRRKEDRDTGKVNWLKNRDWGWQGNNGWD